MKRTITGVFLPVSLTALIFTAGCSPDSAAPESAGMRNGGIEDLVYRSYQFFTMYNANNKIA